MKIGYAGLTHLGIVSSAALADNGFEIVCFDNNSQLVEDLKSGLLALSEPNLPELIARNKHRLTYSSKISDLHDCDVVYISPDVPTDDHGTSDLSGIVGLISTVSIHLNSEATLVVLCQVPPGFTRSIVFPTERLFYQVETLVFGNAVERALHPERLIVGCESPASSLPTCYRIILDSFACPILPMRYESAELAKISINMCLVATVSTANTLAEICESVGADWSEIAPALRLDARIGPLSYLKPGLGISGGNLERDLATIVDLASKYGADAGVVTAWLNNSNHRRNWIHKVLEKEQLLTNQSTMIGVLGLAYKTETHSVKNSPSVALIRSLPNIEVVVHDPVVAPIQLGTRVRRVNDPSSVADGVDALVVMTPWKNYAGLSLEALARRMKGRTLIDPHRLFEPEKAIAAGLDYFTLGVAAYRARRD